MRIAIVSDIHGNLSALEAVVADLRASAPEEILLGGDLAHAGAHPAEVVDRVRGLGWPGVLGNTDEMLFRPAALGEFAATRPSMQPLTAPIEAMAAACRARLGAGRLDWLAGLPFERRRGSALLLHASPPSCWHSPGAELRATYGGHGASCVIYGHIHIPYVRDLPGLTVANSGSVGMPHDGDPRASYLILDHDGRGWRPQVRRIEYDRDPELRALAGIGEPWAEWSAAILRSARPQMP